MKDQATQLTAAETDQVAGGISPVPVPTSMPIPDDLRRRHSIVDPIFDAAQLVEPGSPSPAPGPAPVALAVPGCLGPVPGPRPPFSRSRRS